jgi:P4 family phage/plasmid primase-like protien
MKTKEKLPKVKFYSKATRVLVYDKAPVESLYDLLPEYDVTKEEIDAYIATRAKAKSISIALTGGAAERDALFAKIDEKFIADNPNIVILNRGESSTFHTYKDGVYLPLYDAQVYNLIDDCFARYNLFDHRTSSRKVKDTQIRIVSRLSQIPSRHFSDKDIEKRKWYLNLRNGLLDMKTFELLPHTPDYFSVGQVPYDYDPTAEAPEFLKFIDTITKGNQTTALMLQEMFGYCIMDGNPKHKVFYLYGETARNGKSTTAKILGGLIGLENISTLTLQQLSSDNTSILTSLIGKQINIADEISSKFIDSSRFTSMSAEGIVEVNPKFKPSFLYKITTKFIVACNDLPRFQDAQGMRHRMISIPFRYQIPEVERIDRYEEVLLEKEASGILNWAIAGTKLFTGVFSMNEQSAEDIHANTLENNSTYAFLEREYDFLADYDEKLTSEDLYGASQRGETQGWGFRKFCDESGLPSPSIHTFRRELSRFAEETGKIKQIRDDNFRHYVGLQKKKWDDGYGV